MIKLHLKFAEAMAERSAWFVAAARQHRLRRSAAAASAHADDPRRVIKDAQHLRDMALQFERADPGMASDLYAAADQHELAHLH